MNIPMRKKEDLGENEIENVYFRAQSWPNVSGASWLPDFSIWEPGTIYDWMYYSIIDLITQNV